MIKKIMALAVLVLVVSNFYFYSKPAEVIYINKTIETIKEIVKEVDKKHLFETIAENVSKSHNYSLPPNRFTCADFTAELVKQLKEAGYEAKSVCGIAKWVIPGTGNARHAWTQLTLYIESTTGQILTPEEYDKYYEFSRYCCVRGVC